MGGKDARNRWVVAPVHNARDTHVHVYALKGEAANLLHALTVLKGDPSGAALLCYFSPPLHLASAEGHVACVTLLLERGATPRRDLNERGGRAPLHVAAIGGHVAACAALLDAGCAVDVRDGAGGTTPLHVACFFGHADLVALLLARGAKTDVRATHSGELALHAACRGGRTTIVAALAAHMSDDVGVEELPAVIARLRQPVDAGALYTSPAHHARYSGAGECAAPIEAVVRDCTAKLLPGGPCGEADEAWQTAIGSFADGTPPNPPPEKAAPPAVDELRPDRPPDPPPPICEPGSEFGNNKCRVCHPADKDDRGKPCCWSHSTHQHAAWLRVRRVSRRHRARERKKDLVDGRLAPGQVPWRAW